MIRIIRSALVRTLLVSIGFAAPAAAQSVWHVDASAPPGGNGASWGQAFNSLHRGLFAASVGDSVWVAQGTYRPSIRQDPSDPRSATFLVPQGVAVYGGFAGHELNLAERAGLFRATVLCGDIGVPGDWHDNAYHVVKMNHPAGIPPGPTRLDGFTVTGGNADSSPHYIQGGGIHVFNTGAWIENCIITENRAVLGGGIHAQPGLLVLIRCILTDNHAEDGGAITARALTLHVVNSIFARNTAVDRGGAINLAAISSLGKVNIVGSLFHDNSAERGGAAFLGGGNWASGKGTFRYCTFTRNMARASGGAIHAVTWSPIPAVSQVYGCILWRNHAPQAPELEGEHFVDHSNVRGGAPGPGNLSTDPRFVDPASSDFRLAAGSPCIDAGNNHLVPNDVLDLNGNGDTSELLPYDLARRPRLTDDPATPDTGSGTSPIVDMGAYEFQP